MEFLGQRSNVFLILRDIVRLLSKTGCNIYSSISHMWKLLFSYKPWEEHKKAIEQYTWNTEKYN